MNSISVVRTMNVVCVSVGLVPWYMTCDVRIARIVVGISINVWIFVVSIYRTIEILSDYFRSSDFRRVIDTYEEFSDGTQNSATEINNLNRTVFAADVIELQTVRTAPILSEFFVRQRRRCTTSNPIDKTRFVCLFANFKGNFFVTHADTHTYAATSRHANTFILRCT